MRPQFRSDLQASREEQQGVVFYRIDDPQTQTSFRLYEIEYLIARKLDGRRELNEVIGAVKAEYNFDITEPDLKKFVSQLESMGFITSAAAVSPAPAPAAPAPAAPAAAAPAAVAPAPVAPAPAEMPPDTTQPMGAAAAMVQELQQATPAPSGQPSAVAAVGEDVDDIQVEEPEQETVTNASHPAPSALPNPGVEAGHELDPALPLTEEDVFSTPTVEHPAPLDPLAIDPAGAMDGRRGTTGPDEVLRIIRSGFEHLRKGFVVHARDYFNAARETRPDDDRLAKIATHLAMVPDDAQPQELEQLWSTARDLFPEIAAEVAAELEGEADFPEEEEPLRSRLFWLAVLALVLLLGGGALFYVVKEMNLLQSAVVVQVSTLEASRVPIYYDGVAQEVGPVKQQWLPFQGEGTVVQAAAAGQRVKGGDVLVMLELPGPAQKKLDRAKSALEKARAQYDKAAASLAEIMNERELLEAERDEAERKIQELRPSGILKASGASRRDLEKLKRALVKSNKKLSKLAKKERKPRAQERKAKQRVEKAMAAVAQVEGRLKDRLLRAPFDGVVVETRFTEGAAAASAEEGVLLRDAGGARVVFSLASAGELQPGGEAQVAVEEGDPITGKVLSVEAGDGTVRLTVDLSNVDAELLNEEPEKFHLIRAFVDDAYRVDASAILEAEGQPFSVFVADGGRAVPRPVEILSKGPSRAVIRSADGKLRDGDRVVIAVPELGSLEALKAQTPVEIAR